ncbi:MAG: MarR family transcriptional regulator [Alphaproteobacteria bacterium]
MSADATAAADRAVDAYRLDDQVGFLLRLANQRHTTLFAERMIGELTPTQFAALARLHEAGALSQNELGRMTAMDAATIKGVVDRLRERELVASAPDASDRRRLSLTLTERGRRLARAAIPVAARITAETLQPLPPADRARFVALLARLG